MARAVFVPRPERYRKPSPQPDDPRPVSIIGEDRLFRYTVTKPTAWDEVYTLAALDSSSCILAPFEYRNDWDHDMPSDHDRVQKNLRKICVCFEEMLEDHPRILRFLERDPWTGFPTFATPAESLDGFVVRNRPLLYPPRSPEEAASVGASPPFARLVVTWALQLLSAIKFIHSREVVHGGASLHACYLAPDLSLLLAGFESADFTDSYGYRPLPTEPGARVMDDLRSWGASYFYTMMRPDQSAPYHWTSVHESPDTARFADDFIGVDVLRKLVREDYETAEEVWANFTGALNEAGFEVEGDGVKDFDPAEILGLVAQRPGREEASA